MAAGRPRRQSIFRPRNAPSSSRVVRYELKILYRVATRQVMFEPLDLVVKLADSARQQPTALHNFAFNFWGRE